MPECDSCWHHRCVADLLILLSEVQLMQMHLLACQQLWPGGGHVLKAFEVCGMTTTLSPHVHPSRQPLYTHRYRQHNFVLSHISDQREVEQQTRLKLSSITLVWRCQCVFSCHGFVQLDWKTANAPIKLKQHLIYLSQNQCRSVS